MKILRALCLLICGAAIAAAEDSAAVNGKWHVSTNAAGRSNEQECTFNQKADELTGTCKAQYGPVQLKGKVDGKKVTWTYVTDSEGGTVTVVFKGTLESAKMTGTILSVEFSVEGEFSATLAN